MTNKLDGSMSKENLENKTGLPEGEMNPEQAVDKLREDTFAPPDGGKQPEASAAAQSTDKEQRRGEGTTENNSVADATYGELRIVSTETVQSKLEQIKDLKPVAESVERSLTKGIRQTQHDLDESGFIDWITGTNENNREGMRERLSSLGNLQERKKLSDEQVKSAERELNELKLKERSGSLDDSDKTRLMELSKSLDGISYIDKQFIQTIQKRNELDLQHIEKVQQSLKTTKVVADVTRDSCIGLAAVLATGGSAAALAPAGALRAYIAAPAIGTLAGTTVGAISNVGRSTQEVLTGDKPIYDAFAGAVDATVKDSGNAAMAAFSTTTGLGAARLLGMSAPLSTFAPKAGTYASGAVGALSYSGLQYAFRDGDNQPITEQQDPSAAASRHNLVSNPFAAFANGAVHSIERSYNGVAQLATNNNYNEASIAKVADPSSKLAQGAYLAGDLLGTGLQMVALNRFMPNANSMVGLVAKGAGTGAVYGGVMLPSEGTDLAEERLKSGISMAAFMSTFEAGKLGMFATGFYQPTLLHSTLRGSVAGGLAGGAGEATSKALNGESVTMSDLGIASAKGAVLGSAMELTSTALLRTNANYIAFGDLNIKPAPVGPVRVDTPKAQFVDEQLKAARTGPSGPKGFVGPLRPEPIVPPNPPGKTPNPKPDINPSKPSPSDSPTEPPKTQTRNDFKPSTNQGTENLNRGQDGRVAGAVTPDTIPPISGLGAATVKPGAESPGNFTGGTTGINDKNFKPSNMRGQVKAGDEDGKGLDASGPLGQAPSNYAAGINPGKKLDGNTVPPETSQTKPGDKISTPIPGKTSSSGSPAELPREQIGPDPTPFAKRSAPHPDARESNTNSNQSNEPWTAF